MRRSHGRSCCHCICKLLLCCCQLLLELPDWGQLARTCERSWTRFYCHRCKARRAVALQGLAGRLGPGGGLIIERGRAADVVKNDFVVIGKGRGDPHWLRRRLLKPVSASSHAMNVLRCVAPAIGLPWERRLIVVATQDVFVHLAPGQAKLLGLNSKLLGLTRDQLVLRCQTAFESGHAVLQLVALLLLDRKSVV